MVRRNPMKTEMERREFLRADLNVFLTKRGGVDHLVKAMDICERGVRFTSTSGNVDEPGARCCVEFCLPGEEKTLKVIGRMVYAREVGNLAEAAVEFVAVGAEDAARIRGYVVRRKRSELFDSLRKRHLGI
jgi:hypothetical protein